MAITRFKRIRQSLEELFPERHLYVRSGGEMRGYVFSTGKQLMCATGVAAAALWMGVCTAAMLINVLSVSSTDQMVIKQKAYYERLNADRQARLNSAVAQLSASSGSLDELASSVEKRHAALALLVSDFKGVPGAAQALQVGKPHVLGASPVERIQATRMDQERLIDAAETFAKSRAERLRLAMRMAGLDAGAFTSRDGGSSLGGPLIEAKDPRALAAVLDVDEDFAGRIQHAATDMSDMRQLSAASQQLPFYRPTNNPALSSSYGVRFDPFTHRPAFHSGLDFPGAFYTPIMATAPGVVSYVGVRSGYGNVVEIDHGAGFKTRYAHLQAASVRVGERVAIGQRIAAMGSTGRSTGPHLHYEVWVNGRAQNPNRFLKAGEYVQQAS
ncbi:peptidoglycan DD-metalloendopeptidase family protein [Caulobacter rhizosphaerae]|jgi:murein DD-endopeptidase MepM/ murein hydrolase activator NlpD|uniref:peptidoglycan DD-metalloendopeptidase family protein n=1 Tax=Caulobacter rhizosphaerae TaxID=2010972 RepID=UPI0013D0056F|nr:peptidoglycan DD-metalloendopeptidase family protein [Caulobacter rhizosphaerae]GGL14259.1 peptidase M24 [Caulobacter rhizosphaerae]